MQKTRSAFIRNLILALVLAVSIFLLVIAWFTAMQLANAGELSVTSVRSSGLESSFDDVNYDYDISKDLNMKFSLLSGDGTLFFIPSLDRSTGIPAEDASGKWISKREPVKNQDYLEQDIYFRSTEALSVYLRNTSQILPNDLRDGTLSNKSAFGDFTRDYIAAAARVSFFDVDENGRETLKYTWVPNDTYELMKDSDFTPIQKTESGSDNFNPPSTEGWNLPGEDSDYYLWEGYRINNDDSTVQFKKVRMKQENGKYYAAIDVNSGTNVDHMVYIGAYSGTEAPTEDFTNYTAASSRKQYIDDGIYVTASFEGTYSAANRTWAKLYLDPDKKEAFFSKYDRFQVVISFEPSKNNLLSVEDFVFYNETDPSIAGGNVPAAGGKQEKYTLTAGNAVVITGDSEGDLYALSAEDTGLGAGKVGAVSQESLSNVNSKYLFIVEQGASADAYKFRSVLTNTYLTVDAAGDLTLSDVSADFVLSAGVNGPLLNCGNKYIAFLSGGFIAADSDSAMIHIYTGNPYRFTTESGNTETYQYYTAAGGVQNLSNYYLTSNLNTAPAIASLAKVNAVDFYYKAHIRVKIWVEGTDREAQIPLAGGCFSNLLDFQGVKKNS